MFGKLPGSECSFGSTRLGLKNVIGTQWSTTTQSVTSVKKKSRRPSPPAPPPSKEVYLYCRMHLPRQLQAALCHVSMYTSEEHPGPLKDLLQFQDSRLSDVGARELGGTDLFSPRVLLSVSSGTMFSSLESHFFLAFSLKFTLNPGVF